MTRLRPFPVLIVAVIAVTGVLLSGQDMPDPRQMSGMPLPVGDVPTGTVTVRVIRGSFANPVASQTVEIIGAAMPLRAVTSEAGRAEFSGLPVGARLRATATVGAETVESQEFAVPASGGIRLILVAAAPEEARPPAVSGEAAAAAGRGSVMIGEESRFVFEMGEAGLSVFYVLQVVNRSNAPVEPERPLVFEIPAAARSATILDGSSPLASVAGRQLRIAGPIAPGPTLVQLAYTMPLSGPEIVIEQPLPATLAHVAVVAQKIGGMELSSPQLAEQRTMPAQGNLYIAGRGGAVQAGEVLRFHFTGVPHHPIWPRNLALSLAVLVLAAGVWSAVRASGPRRAQAAHRRQLQVQRDRLFGELATLESRLREGALDPDRYGARRRELVSALEDLYAALDDEVALDRAS